MMSRQLFRLTVKGHGKQEIKVVCCWWWLLSKTPCVLTWMMPGVGGEFGGCAWEKRRSWRAQPKVTRQLCRLEAGKLSSPLVRRVVKVVVTDLPHRVLAWLLMETLKPGCKETRSLQVTEKSGLRLQAHSYRCVWGQEHQSPGGNQYSFKQ